jgi:hypothetical protein
MRDASDRVGTGCPPYRLPQAIRANLNALVKDAERAWLRRRERP